MTIGTFKDFKAGEERISGKGGEGFTEKECETFTAAASLATSTAIV